MLGLDRSDRLNLMKFICSFAWADLEVQPEERVFVARLLRRLQLDAAETSQVERWLQVPPRPEEVDPTKIPEEHRKLFMDTIVGLIEADGVIADEEREQFAIFESLLDG